VAIESSENQSDLEDEALAWIVRLRSGSATGADREAFAHWCARSPDHRRAAAQAEALWSDIGRTEAAAGRRLDVVAGRRRPGSRSGGLSRRRLLAGGIAAAAAVAVVGGGALDMFGPAGDYRTATGERRAIPLPDGSEVWLNTRSALSVAIGGDRRHVRLLEGEALFRVAADPSRPFVVDCGACTVQALGTLFSLRRFERGPVGAEVVVAEGRVRVGAGSEAGRQVEAVRDQIVRIPADGGLPARADADAAAKIAWHRGKLIFNRRPLAEVLDEVGRYVPERFVVLTDDIEALRVTGVFDLERPDTLLSAMERILPIRTTRLPYLTIIS